FVSLDEYGVDAFLHISEVSSGWVRNIREHIKEGQKIVVLITRVDLEKRQVDASLKKVSEADRKRKLESYQLGKRAEKLLERVAAKAGKTPQQAKKEAGDALAQEFGDLYSAFEALAAGEEPKAKVPAAWLNAMREVAKAEIKEKFVGERGVLKLKSFAGDGVVQVKAVLAAVEKLSSGKVSVVVRYIGAPVYYVDVQAPDPKTLGKTMAKIEQAVQNVPKSVESSFEREKK
ncbi:MAG: S1 RNA-binding domain-containing protein, partial [Candidatus Micrarchaeota archaeon]